MMESSRPRYFVILSISILQFLSVITPNEQVGNLNDINEGKRYASVVPEVIALIVLINIRVYELFWSSRFKVSLPNVCF